MSSVVSAVYYPGIFDVVDLPQARNIILTEDGTLSPDDRWATETPYLIKLMEHLELDPQSVVLDYGCGVGRLSGALIEAYGCRVVGVDISASMRRLALAYVDSDRFAVCHPSMLGVLGTKFDAVLAVWVLQHCPQPAADIAVIKSALCLGGRLFVVNETARFVPTEVGWVHDGIDVRGLIERGLACEREGKLDPTVVVPATSARTYWGIFHKGG